MFSFFSVPDAVMISAVLTESKEFSVWVSPGCIISCLLHSGPSTSVHFFFLSDWQSLAVGSYFLFDYPYCLCFLYFFWGLVPKSAHVSYQASLCLLGLIFPPSLISLLVDVLICQLISPSSVVCVLFSFIGKPISLLAFHASCSFIGADF